MARIVEGTGFTRQLIDLAPRGVNELAMDLDDLFPGKPGDPLVELSKQDLDPISIEELHARIEKLKAEIARVEVHMHRAVAHRSAAEQLFRR